MHGRPSRAPAVALAVLAAAFCSVFLLGAQESDETYARRRRDMIEHQLRARDIKDPRVLAVMGEIPRHLFVDPEYRDQAYEDYPLPIGEGQTISQPYIVALMTQCLNLKGKERVLEVGTGSGYQAAVLARLAEKVYSVEINTALAERAAVRLRDLGFANVEVRGGDGYFGWPEAGPFDAVIVTASALQVPQPLFQQLREGGRLVIPIEGTGDVQTLTVVTKAKGKPRIDPITLVRFVPMTGEGRKKK